MSDHAQMTLLLLGCGVDSNNRGVSALGMACIANLHKAFPQPRLIADGQPVCR